MSKWRPSTNCLYVIPDIHGMYNELNLILNRILPLRKSDGIKDKLVFLGDYIDRGAQSHKVIDLVMEVKRDQPDQVVLLQGNHEILLRNAIAPNASSDDYLLWMHNGGEQTFRGYLERNKSDIDNPFLIPRNRVFQFIPPEHIKFFNNLSPYYETEEYIFVHGGCDPMVPLNKQEATVLAWDRSVFKLLSKTGFRPHWNKTIVTGHNGVESGKFFVTDKFLMLDGTLGDILYVCELNSRTGFSATKGNKRLVKEKFTT